MRNIHEKKAANGATASNEAVPAVNGESDLPLSALIYSTSASVVAAAAAAVAAAADQASAALKKD